MTESIAMRQSMYTVKPVGLPLVTNGPDNANDNANNNANPRRGRFWGHRPA